MMSFNIEDLMAKADEHGVVSGEDFSEILEKGTLERKAEEEKEKAEAASDVKEDL